MFGQTALKKHQDMCSNRVRNTPYYFWSKCLLACRRLFSIKSNIISLLCPRMMYLARFLLWSGTGEEWMRWLFPWALASTYKWYFRNISSLSPNSSFSRLKLIWADHNFHEGSNHGRVYQYVPWFIALIERHCTSQWWCLEVTCN